MLLRAIFAATLACALVFGQQPMSVQKVSDEIEHFYLEPSYERGCELCKKIIKTGQTDTFCPFFVAFFGLYPEKAVATVQNCGADLGKHPIFLYSLWISGFGKEAILLAKQAKWSAEQLRTVQGVPAKVLQIPLDSSLLIDMMRVHFCMTGNEKYIARMLDLFGVDSNAWPDPRTLQDMQEQGKAAFMNLIQCHDRAYRYCCAELQKLGGKKREALQSMLDQFKAQYEQLELDGRNGFFGGRLILTDAMEEAAEKWQTTPMHVLPELTTVSEIRRGKNYGIYPLFAGFALDQEAKAHVTYDLRIIDSSGKIVYEKRNCEGLNRKLASRFLAQVPDECVGIYIGTPESKGLPPESSVFLAPGNYALQATLKDEIGAQEVVLTKPFELIGKLK